MGKSYTLDGIKVEVHSKFLALREYGTPDRDQSECLPEILEEGSIHEFLKIGDGQRIFAQEIDLAETRGNEELSESLARIEILSVDNIFENGKVHTIGEYKIKKVYRHHQPSRE